ncbi:hypothetical protein AYI68_g3781 [Smittium mucronatum]|uniref:Uncharacterized protein n=1 Tax=Smittium mucronatum TaxID=133383 RepID=A0A1R0GYY4_9FUNG|nr:hypothetical protein AYI68_g3781 [Smittium mucronatum]
MVERGHGHLIDALSKYCQGNPGYKQKKAHKSCFFAHESVLSIELKYLTWNMLNWDSTKTTVDLISAHMYQLEAKEELVTDVAQKLKEFRERNREYFEPSHKIRRDG